MSKPLTFVAAATLASGPAFAHDDHGHSFADLMLHLVSDAFHLWPLALGLTGAILLGVLLYQGQKPWVGNSKVGQ